VSSSRYKDFSAVLTKAGVPTSGVLQVETAVVVGTITLAGNAKFTVTAAGMTGSPKDISVAVALNDTAAQVAAVTTRSLTTMDTWLSTLNLKNLIFAPAPSCPAS